MKHGKEKSKSGGQLAQTKDDDWMWHKPTDVWEQLLTKWETQVSYEKQAFEQQDNDGAAWENTKKVEDCHADWTGKGMIGGDMYWIAVTDKVSAAGKPYKKLKFNRMEARSEVPAAAAFRGAPEKAKDDVPW